MGIGDSCPRRWLLLGSRNSDECERRVQSVPAGSSGKAATRPKVARGPRRPTREEANEDERAARSDITGCLMGK